MMPGLADSSRLLYFRARPNEQKLINHFVERDSSYLAGVNLTDAEVAEFQAIYEKTTGSRIDLDTAREKATKLISFVHALIRSANLTEENDA